MKMKQTTNRRFIDDFDTNFEKIKHNRTGAYVHQRSPNTEKEIQLARSQSQFRCIQCGQVVSTSRECSGVNNRNHCPVCLWSRHVDQLKAGDRRSVCRSRMEPVGLTLKHTLKRYGEEKQGELMLVHRCTGCGKFSINRVAADDNAARIYQLFLQTQRMDSTRLSGVKGEGITPLQACDLTTVHTQLFGWQSLLEEFQAAEDSSTVSAARPVFQSVEQD